jgi:nucleotide-binding universal stress UspA family protein
MKETARQEIVVGVSGSRASVAALRWAVDEARRRCARLSVVCAWDHSRPAPYADRSEGRARSDAQAAMRSSLAAAMRTALGPVPPAEIEAEMAEGAAERVLIDRSAVADLLVLGAARPQQAVGLPVGPVIRACLARAGCPVVVVRASLGPAAGQPEGCPPARVSALAG